MNGKGYTFKSSKQSASKIVVYGRNNAVTHFSRITGSTTCRAKWGPSERFDHASLGPCYSSGIYGSVYGYYY